MIQLEVNQQVARNQQEALAALFVNNPETRKRIKKIVREELKDAAKRAREDARYELPNDPRKAFRAVKFSVYKRIIGGNISILSRRKAGARYELRRSRKLDSNPYQRGGNRRPRSSETERMDSYFGADRGFILRFLNSGTQGRNTRYGYRGAIAARNWFENMAQKEMELAAENLASVINEELVEAYNEIDKT